MNTVYTGPDRQLTDFFSDPCFSRCHRRAIYQLALDSETEVWALFVGDECVHMEASENDAVVFIATGIGPL